jgi:DNA-binding YbaB/EbfC family protein
MNAPLVRIQATLAPIRARSNEGAPYSEAYALSMAKGLDMNALLQQAQQMQAQMAQAQEELAKEVVEASAGGGLVTVKATGAGEITEIKIDPKAIDPDDPELLEDLVLAAVNEALRSAQALVQSKLGGTLGSLGLPGL